MRTYMYYYEEGEKRDGARCLVRTARLGRCCYCSADYCIIPAGLTGLSPWPAVCLSSGAAPVYAAQ